MKADHQAMNGYIGVDYSLAVHLFVGRPRFELREKRAALVAEEKRKAKQEEDQKRRKYTIFLGPSFAAHALHLVRR